ncbi:SDR family NAD(P)-dependent oxidoreductase [Fodinicurvata sp. EGI_FJ10296]|uniref:SDR family NAD(P)-dependent oxidoreductase n=1 Tax=Fodinicurvata sp. EGI_FJ10296 TaxID=3231908 RepID=UPI003451FC20
MPARHSDGVAWVTGASQGIGEAVCLRLARDGWTVVASARSADKLDALAGRSDIGPGRIVAMALDVTDGPAVDRAVDRIIAHHGPIALAVLNAGTYLADNAETLSAETLVPTVDLNFVSVARCLQALLGPMRAVGKGHVQVVSSVSGYRGLPNAASYGATKAALINLAESLKLDFDRFGLTLQLVNPGFVKTPLTDRNDFPMPFLISAEKAADRIVAGAAKRSFEVTFPRRFTFLLKVLRCLPYALYFPIVRRMTGV